MAAKKSTSKKPADLFTAVKGMHDIMGEDFYAYQGFFEKAQEIAEYYGFKPIATPILEHLDIFAKGVGEGTDIVDKEMYTLSTKGGDNLVMRPEATAAIMRAYIEHGMKSLPQPVMLYWYGPVFRHEKPQRGRYRQFHQFDLEILGSEKSIVDALIIQTTTSILKAAGAKDLYVDINSIGDVDSRKDYIKELKNYYRKHLNDLAEVDRERLKTNPLRILDSKEPATIAINEDAPDSVSHLSNTSKKHFKEVLEYLEEMDVDYRINKNLVRGLDYYSNTVFEIMESVTDEATGESRNLAITGGGRYDYLATTMGYKKDIPGVGVGIGVERVIESSWWNKLNPRNIKPPKIYFIQLGFDAKLKSISILESLRQAKIPVYQALSKDSLSSQLGVAEKMNIPYVVIFGQKEAMDGTILVRDMVSRSQKTVKIPNMIKYLKSLK